MPHNDVSIVLSRRNPSSYFRQVRSVFLAHKYCGNLSFGRDLVLQSFHQPYHRSTLCFAHHTHNVGLDIGSLKSRYKTYNHDEYNPFLYYSNWQRDSHRELTNYTIGIKHHYL